jgi:hypothetical protein
MAGTTPAFLAAQIAAAMMHGTAYQAPATVYAALTVADSSDATAGTECSDATYARQPVTPASLFSRTGGVDTTILDILWPGATAAYTVHAVEFYDSLLSSGSNNRVLPYIPISSVVVPINEQFKLPAGSGSITVS